MEEAQKTTETAAAPAGVATDIVEGLKRKDMNMILAVAAAAYTQIEVAV